MNGASEGDGQHIHAGLAWLAESPEGRAWLARLPRLVDECVEQWSLRIGDPFPYAFESFASAAILPVAESVAEIAGTFFPGAPKNWQRRTIAIPPFLGDLLAAHLSRAPDDPDALAFADGNGNFLRHSNFRQRVWIPALQAAGLPEDLRIHDMRHTCAALLIAQGAPPQGHPGSPRPLLHPGDHESLWAPLPE